MPSYIPSSVLGLPVDIPITLEDQEAEVVFKAKLPEAWLRGGTDDQLHNALDEFRRRVIAAMERSGLSPNSQRTDGQGQN
jgi:hypothetical protein